MDVNKCKDAADYQDHAAKLESGWVLA